MRETKPLISLDQVRYAVARLFCVFMYANVTIAEGAMPAEYGTTNEVIWRYPPLLKGLTGLLSKLCVRRGLNALCKELTRLY